MISTSDLNSIRKPKKAKRDLTPLPPIGLFIDATGVGVIAARSGGWFRMVLPYPPSVNEMYPIAVRGKRALKYLSEEGKRYQKFVGQIALAVGVRPVSGDVDVRVEVYRPQKSGDLDNIFKATFDSLKGIAWIDDKQVRRIVAERKEDPGFPRVVIFVRVSAGETLDFEGFFK